MTLLERVLGRRHVESAVAVVAPQMESTVIEAKAATGFGVTALTYSQPLWTLAQSPQKMAWQAAKLYGEHGHIWSAESVVSEAAGSVDWHLEDANDDEVTDASDPSLLVIRDLIEKPQDALPLAERQPGMTTRRNLWTTTLRHMGLCGTSFWYLDQTDALGGVPLAILYIAPWRMYPVLTEGGGLRGWSLDAPFGEQGARPLELANVLPFYLHPPDQGYFASGNVAAAATKIPLSGIIDRHIAQVIGSGGRLAGMIAPKAGSVVSEDNWAQFVRDYRSIAQSQDAALRLQIVQGAVDYVRTAATLDELAITTVDERAFDAILAIWRVPRSQAAIAAPAGLNSGSTKGFDEAILWQGPIDARLQAFYETVQYGLLDRYKRLGIGVELVLDPPEFDDVTPLYQRAQQAANIPLTNNERRAIVGLAPLEKDYEAWGEKVLLPISLAEIDPNPPPEPVVPPPMVPGVVPPPSAIGQPAKASLGRTRFAALRRSVDAQAVPRLKSAVMAVLARQKGEVISHLRSVGLEGLRKGGPALRQSDRVLADALRPELGRIAAKVSERTRAVLATAKASDDFTVAVIDRVLTRGAGRVKGINATTRDAVAAAISDALTGADTIDDVINAVNALDVFGELRAETIARTESMFAYNAAALGSYTELGVDTVEAIDGDGDPECAARDGRTYSIDEAEGIEDHPNGTLDFLPILPDEEPPAKATRTEIEYDELGRIVAWVSQ